MPTGGTDGRPRCAWGEMDPLLVGYHDREWGVPVHDGAKLWGKLALDGFQAGLSWLTILRKREAFYRAFEGFDPLRVARYGDKEVARLLADPGIVRSRAKIRSTISGARAYLAMEAAGESFDRFVWGFVDGRPIQNRGPVPAKTPLSEEVSDALRSRGFTFVGPTIVYAWMQAVGLVNDHAPRCFRRAEIAALGRTGNPSRRRASPTKG